MSDENVKIGFCGVGSMGQMAHLRNYAVDESCEIVALAELRKNTGQAVARRYEIPRVYGEAAEMLASETLDAIVAAQPFTRHGVLVPELLKAGVPVFTEKPLAGSVEVGVRIVEAVAESGTFMMLGYHKRSDPATMHAKREIDALKASGELGRLRYVRILMPAGDWIAAGFEGLVKEAEDVALSLESDPPASDMDESTYKDYTAFVNYYIHQVNLMRHLLGEPYRVTYAEPSGVLFAGESESGVACTIEMSPYRTTVDWQEHALVCFEKGWLRVDLPAPLACNRPGRVEIYRDPGDGATPERSEPKLPWIHAMRQQAANFIAAVKGEMKPMTTAAEALQDLEMAREYIRLKTGK
ncbi:MAG: Gfo/Idh/MocA family oxidoreductase [Candidatus Latescibacteria bacterium]|nr:Gfo/Idh/MocA family oxidoreductase [Candidatus Latescibacterota bacterium]